MMPPATVSRCASSHFPLRASRFPLHSIRVSSENVIAANRRIIWIAAVVFLADQSTKLVVLWLLGPLEERPVIDGFFKFVHWQNTGAAFSMFHQKNGGLAVISTVAMAALWFFRRHFEAHRTAGQVALGLLFGGIAGNLLDRLLPGRRHVIDFIRFYLEPRGGGEIGFPAFNVADTAICTGVGLLILLSWQMETGTRPAPAAER